MLTQWYTGKLPTSSTTTSTTSLSSTTSFDVIVEPSVTSTGNLWTPAQLGSSLVLWLDAADSGTITLNGSTVSQWDDKSGNSNNVSQGTAASQPTFAASGLNGAPSLVFETDAKFLDLPDGNPTLGNTDLNAIDAGDRFAVFAVGDGGDGTAKAQTNVGRAGVMVGKAGGIGNQGTFVLGLLTHNSVDAPLNPPRWFGQFNGWTGVGGAENNQNWSAGALSTPTVVGVVWDGTTVTGTVNGTTFSNSGPIGSITNQDAPVRIGGTSDTLFAPSTTGGGNSKTSEVVICDDALSTNDRQKLEGYLAWKWGLEGNLPAAHPYIEGPPLLDLKTGGVISLYKSPYWVIRNPFKTYG